MRWPRLEVRAVTKNKITTFLFENKVVVLFVFLCIGGTIASGQSMNFVVSELFTRIARNSFLVLALIIPVLAGLGLNFGIVIGAMAAQIAIFFTTHWGFTGVSGFLLTALLSTPLAVFFGYLVGKLFNNMKGAEMIGGLVLGYFTDGLYQLFFLFILVSLLAVAFVLCRLVFLYGVRLHLIDCNSEHIPLLLFVPVFLYVDNPKLMISTGVGVKNTIDLKDTIKYSLDTVPMLTIIEFGFYIAVAVTVISAVVKLAKKQEINWKRTAVSLVGLVVVYALTFIPAVERFLSSDRLRLLNAVELACFGTLIWQAVKFALCKMRKTDWPRNRAIAACIAAALLYALTYVPGIAALCFFNTALMKTRLGQNMRTVGQSRVVANAAGINVDRTRIIAMIFSTVLASWGQLIFLQNVGTFSTYGAHTQVGQFAIASLVVGGASVQKATNKQAIIGVILFHTLFIVAPLAGKELFGNAMIGEYFRVIVSYGVIAMSLAMHAWKKVVKPRLEANAAAGASPAGEAAQ